MFLEKQERNQESLDKNFPQVTPVIESPLGSFTIVLCHRKEGSEQETTNATSWCPPRTVFSKYLAFNSAPFSSPLRGEQKCLLSRQHLSVNFNKERGIHWFY